MSPVLIVYLVTVAIAFVLCIAIAVANGAFDDPYYEMVEAFFCFLAALAGPVTLLTLLGLWLGSYLTGDDI